MSDYRFIYTKADYDGQRSFDARSWTGAHSESRKRLQMLQPTRAMQACVTQGKQTNRSLHKTVQDFFVRFFADFFFVAFLAEVD